MKSFDDLEYQYENAVLTKKEYNEIVDNENVECVDSGKYCYTAYSTELDKDGYPKEFDFYMEREDGK